MSERHLVLVSNASQTCGVEEFARQLALRTTERSESWRLDRKAVALMRRLRSSPGIVLNFPVVAWKKRLLRPLLVALAARLRGRRVVVVLHEWNALDWKRRLVLAPIVALATRLVFSAPEIARELAASGISPLAPSDRRVVPIPPNLLPPLEREATQASAVLAEQRQKGRLILGQFGSIYPKKQSTAVLEVAQRLIARGHDVFVVFVGSFIKGLDSVERDFMAAVERTGLAERVFVTGYVANDCQLFDLFDRVDLFCYVFPEGLTARRASVLAAAMSGRPVIVNAPVEDDALDHHVLYRALIGAGAVRLVPTDADADAVADAVIAAKARPPRPVDLVEELDGTWRAVAAEILG